MVPVALKCNAKEVHAVVTKISAVRGNSKKNWNKDVHFAYLGPDKKRYNSSVVARYSPEYISHGDPFYAKPGDLWAVNVNPQNKVCAVLHKIARCTTSAWARKEFPVCKLSPPLPNDPWALEPFSEYSSQAHRRYAGRYAGRVDPRTRMVLLLLGALLAGWLLRGLMKRGCSRR